MNSIKEKTDEKRLYISGLIIAAISILLFCLYNISFFDMFIIFPECVYYRMLGIPCPGCGTTRALRYLINGNIIDSIRMNAIVFYTIGVYLVFMITHTIEWIFCSLHRKTVIKGLRFHVAYVYIGVAVLLIHWIIRVLTNVGVF